MDDRHPEPDQRLPAQARTLFALQATAGAAPLVLLALGARMALDSAGAPGWTGVAVLALAALAAVAMVAVEPRLRWRNWRYALREEEIDLRRGVLVVTRTLIPTIRVQHVDTQRTWLSDRLGLRAVVVHTAGGSHRIPALRPDTATAIRDRIAELARRPDDV
ncbi:MAG: PH domain-containing protein [Solirubrobacterales bacterium]|nr:PH domain-containing protein [Solirubrobacterales bacterium]